MSKILAATNLSKAFRRRQVVHDVSLELASGEVVGLLGPNGAGKTTSFYILVGLINADGGSVTLDDHDITELPMHARARLGLGYLPQEPSVFRKLSVEQNLLAVLEARPGLSRADPYPIDTEVVTPYWDFKVLEFHRGEDIGGGWCNRGKNKECQNA